MPQVTVYIRKEDLAKWEAVEKKSEFIHNALEGRAVPGKQTPPKATETPKTKATEFHRVITLSEAKVEEDEYDPLSDLVYERRINTVWDTSTGEMAEGITRKDVDELVRRGQVR